VATYEELFGKKSGGNFGPSQPKWDEPGDKHVGVMTGEPTEVPQRDFTAKADKFMVKTGGGQKGWEPKNEGDFDKELDHFALTQLSVPVDIDGQAHVILFTGQREEALKDEMKETGISLVAGTTVGVKFLRLKGKQKIYSVKLVAAAE